MSDKQRAKRRKFLDALVAGDRLSKQDVLRRFRLWNAGDAVLTFRKEGWPIETVMCHERGERFARYFIPREGNHGS